MRLTSCLLGSAFLLASSGCARERAARPSTPVSGGESVAVVSADGKPLPDYVIPPLYPVTPRSEALSLARSTFGHLKGEEVPGGGVGFVFPTYFEAGQSDVEFCIFMSQSRPEQEEMWCMKRNGGERTTLWKVQLGDVKHKLPPHAGTLRTMLYREGQEPIGNVTDSAKASLDKIVAYAGYEWSIPGSGIHVTFIYPSGEAKTDRSQYEGGMDPSLRFPISMYERRELGWTLKE